MRLSAAVLLAVGALCAPAIANAFSYVMPPDEALVDSADGVVVARVVGTPFNLPRRPGLPKHAYRLHVEEVLSGRALAGAELVLPGGWDSAGWLQVQGIPVLADGERVLLAYGRRPDGRLAARELSLGIFHERVGRDGERLYVRSVSAEDNLAKSFNAAYAAFRDADRFEQWVRDRARGLVRAPDYLLPQAQLGPQPKFTQLIFPFADPGPARWFEFDSGGQVEWRALQGGQAGMLTDEFLQLQQALAAWENDPGSKIDFTYGGTTAADGAGFETVLWNDPDNEIDGSYNCSGGVLGIGGSFARTPRLTFEGNPYYQSFDGFVVVQDGAGCYFDDDSGRNGAEVLTHELGHSLGFGHACGDSGSPSCSDAVLNAATMRASAHGDGRGADLGVDDQAGAAFVYPSGEEPGAAFIIFRNGFED